MKRLIAASLMFLAGTAWAGKADVVNATATKSGESYRFSATVEHADEGWEHYADAWRVVTAEGEVLGTRVLHHPHVNEQPFTRSLSGVMIPDDITEVYVEAHDSVHGWGGKQFKVALD
ncbi:hypothetical protein D515_04297 [Grimontia indica]|uniref:Uncharacterized protein n=1 Tax=Grimontia indica TaxID=1056512 RepID=R1J1B8_9GAMM|nr:MULTISPECIES: hypothetical protein [Grimontia]EOD81395.1 hypothetical protein D515_04297 [Grimontia indica]